MSMFRLAYIAVIAMLVYLFCIMISLRAQMQPEQSGERNVAVPVASEIARPMPRDEKPAVKSAQETEPFADISSEEDAFVEAAKMPDITGTWQLQESKSSIARIQKSDEDGFDYELHWSVRGQGRPALQLKWHTTTNAFVATAPWPVEKASHDDAVYVVKAILNNTVLKVTINLGEKAQKHYEKLREEEKANKTILDPIWFPQMTFVRLELDLHDVISAPAPPPIPVGQEEPTAAQMPDISGGWKLEDNEIAWIEPSKADDANFEIRDEIGRLHYKLKWDAEKRSFSGKTPVSQDGADHGNITYSFALNANDNTLLVDQSFDEKAQLYFEEIGEDIDTSAVQMTWVRHQGKKPLVAPQVADAEPTVAEMPNITGQWRLHEYENGTASIRKLDAEDADYELVWPDDQRNRPSLKLKWLPQVKAFEGTAPWPLETWARGNAVYRVTPNQGLGGYRRLDVVITPGEEAREHYETIVEKLKADGAKPAHLGVLLTPQWQKVDEPVNFRFGKTDITAPPQTPKQVESQNLLIVETEDGIAGYSKTLGTWDRVEIEGEERLKHAIVSQDFASVIIGDELYGFSSESGKWGAMTILKKHASTGGPTHSLNMMSIQLGDTTYIFSPQKAEWTSPTETAEATKVEMPDISGTWQMPEFKNVYVEMFASQRLDSKHPSGLPHGVPGSMGYRVQRHRQKLTGFYLEWNAAERQFKGKGKWPLHEAARGEATYVVTTNEDSTVLNVDITLDDLAQKTFDTLAEKLAADGKTREEIEQQLLHPKWHRSVSPELVKLFKGDSSHSDQVEVDGKTYRFRDTANGPNGPFTPDVDLPDTPKTLATPEMRRLQAFITELENRSAETASEIRAIVKKKLAAEPADETMLGELRENLKITLAEALDLKLQLEAQQVEHLESRLTRLKGLMDQRKSLRDQIIDRRMHELLDTDATKWDMDVAKGEANNAPQSGGSVRRQPAAGNQTITIDLYGGGSKAHFDVVAALNKLPDVATNTHEFGEGKIRMAIVSDPSQRTKDDKLKQAILEALQRGVENILWKYAIDSEQIHDTSSSDISVESVGPTLANDMGSRIAVAPNDASETGEVRRVSSPGDRVWTLDMSPDGKFCVAAVGNEALEGMKVHLFDVRTGAVVRQLANGVRDYVVRFANDGKWILQANYNGELWITETATGDEIRRFKMDVAVWDVHVIGSSKYAVVTSPGVVHVRNLDTGEPIRRWNHKPEQFLWTPSVDGRTFYYSVDGSLPFNVLNLETGNDEKLPESLKDKKTFSFLPDGRHRAKDDAIVTIYDTSTGEELNRLDLTPLVKDAVDWQLLDDLRYVVVWYKNHRLAIWDTTSHLGWIGFQSDDAVRTWRISPDARHIVVATTTGTLHFWRLLDLNESIPTTSSEGSAPHSEKTPTYLSMFYATSGEQIIEDPNLIPHLDNRFQVSLFGEKITDADVQKLMDFKKLKELSLCDVNVVGPGLAGVSDETNITGLYLLGPHATDEWLKNLPRNSKLDNLYLTGSSITDAGLQHLEKLPWLERLDLSDTFIGDEGMKALAYVPGLETLSLKNTLVSDEGLKNLQHVPRLKRFSLGSPNVQGYELARLRDMGELTDLQFIGEGATDEWMAAVERLQNITFFELHSTRVTSEGIRAMRDWKMLTKLYLNNNPALDDRIVDHLKGLNRLQIVEFSGTSVTPDGAAELQKALPKARVLYRAAQNQPAEKAAP